MIIKMRYDDKFQELEIDVVDAGKWMNVSIDECESQEDFERKIQEQVDVQFNRPEYNNWHKFDRHRGFSKARPNDKTDEIDTSEPFMDEVMDPTVFYKEELDRHEQWDYEDRCNIIRKVLKPLAAEMVISIVLDGLSIGEYAESIGDDANNVSHRYRRAINKLKKVFEKTSFQPYHQGYQLGGKGLQEILWR